MQARREAYAKFLGALAPLRIQLGALPAIIDLYEESDDCLPTLRPMTAPRRRDALDISGFVHAATGARVRRLTLPDGTHWFPAVDVCGELGCTTARKALLDHVPERHREMLQTVTGGHSLGIPAGREWRRDLQTRQAVERALPRPAPPPPASPLAAPAPAPAPATLSAEQLLSAWRARLTVTEDVWAVAVVLAPALAERGEARCSVEALAARTGLTTARVHDSLRFLLKRQAIRRRGTTPEGNPVYLLHHA